MNPIFKRFFGISFIIFAVIGILISLGGVYGVWRVRSTVLVKLSETVELVDNTLSATYDGLTIMEKMLFEVLDTIDSSENVMLAMSQTMGDINKLTSGFLGGFLTRFSGSQGGDTSLENTTDNIAVFETELENIAENFSQVSASMNETQSVVEDYQDAIIQTQGQINDFQTNGPKWINMITWVLTILLVWFAITQVGFIIQGVEFMKTAKYTTADPPHEGME
jgi:hypothetical protein